MRLTLSLATCIVLAAIGCGGGNDASGRAETGPAQVPLTDTGATTSDGSSAARPSVASVRLSRIGTFDAPTYVAAPPADKRRLFVVEQAGAIRVVRDGHKLPAPFLDLRSDVQSGGERGLLSMAFAPDYANSGLFYVYFTGQDGDIRIQQVHRATADRADPGSRRELIRIEHSAFTNHNGGQLQFGPDGHLYAGIGDGGSEGDPFRNAQNPSRPYGKILRFDAARRTAQIWALGLRNPWRFSFDRLTGDVVIADVGQDKYEEVDFVKRGQLRGKNFGWSKYEGFHTYYGGAVSNYAKPVLERSHSQGYCSITGGYVVRDHLLKALYGRYVYGDYCEPDLRWAKLRPGRATAGGAIGLRVPALTSFGEDARGRVYALSQNGPVYRLAPA